MSKLKNLIHWVRNALGLPTPESVFGEEGIPHSKEPYAKGTPGPRFGELPVGTYFAVIGKENYPKVKLEGTEDFPLAYYDLSFQLKHAAPDPTWPTVIYTEAEVREIFRKKGIPADRIDALLKQRRTVEHDGQL